MAAVGLPVPPGFHITTTAYRRFVEANALQALIAETTASAQPDDPASLERVSAAVRQLFQSGAVPDAISTAIRGGYADLGAAELTGAGGSDPPLTAVCTAYATPPLLALFHPPIERPPGDHAADSTSIGGSTYHLGRRTQP